mmetsp:Transcript_2413/g.4746  ORF Transcript_2413/g.4746 Transcript_2413/m.4746 type:complete len:240 (+) Transcript_2413:2607-3326(+)
MSCAVGRSSTGRASMLTVKTSESTVTSLSKKCLTITVNESPPLLTYGIGSGTYMTPPPRCVTAVSTEVISAFFLSVNDSTWYNLPTVGKVLMIVCLRSTICETAKRLSRTIWLRSSMTCTEYEGVGRAGFTTGQICTCMSLGESLILRVNQIISVWPLGISNNRADSLEISSSLETLPPSLFLVNTPTFGSPVKTTFVKELSLRSISTVDDGDPWYTCGVYKYPNVEFTSGTVDAAIIG